MSEKRKSYLERVVEMTGRDADEVTFDCPGDYFAGAMVIGRCTCLGCDACWAQAWEGERLIWEVEA